MEQDSQKKQDKYRGIGLKEINLLALEYCNPVQTNSKEKLEAFKKRLEAFKGVYTLYEAKELLKKSMPVQRDRTVFYIGDAKCTIINTSQQVRICLNSPTEFVCYQFI